MRARKECPPDLKLAWLRSIPEIPRRSDDLPVLSVHRNKGASGRQRLEKIFSEDGFLVAFVGRMQFPDLWVRSRGEQHFRISGPQRSEFKKLADEVRLQVETLHVWAPHSGRLCGTSRPSGPLRGSQ